MRITDLNRQNMSDFKMKVKAADSSSSARPHHHDSNNYNTYHHNYYQNRDLFNNNTNNNNNDDDQVNIENNDARSSSKPGGNCFQVPHQKDGHLQSCSTKHSPSFNRDESLNRAYYDTQQRLFRHSQQNRTTSSRGVMHPPEQVSSSPATDVSVIPWIRNLPSSCSELDSRPQSCIKTEAEASSTSSFNSNSMDTVADFERRKSAKAEPIRPIPHMVPSEFLRRGIIYPPDNSRPPSTPFSVRSTVIDFGSRNSSSFSSPRHSAVRRGQKRGLSISPLSTECIDLNAIIRTSPNSLVAFITGSRGSSAASRASRASGSYGHLSAASISPSPFCTPVPGYFGRQRNPFSTPSLPRTPSATLSHRVDSHEQQATSSSSSFNADAKKLEHKNVLDVKKEEGRTSCAVTHQDAPDRALETASKTETFSDEDNDELTTDFRCYWSNCGNVYDDQTGLVAHVNNDHIQKSKKDCTCYWKDCAREEKPFKAMYMLVVHVRRHTGEKPHACDFPGCSKAYSRLENLKTHRRSHTGERPYACEFEGCNKAFSNASDRAKHQNRTHSSIKQYGCKVEGCPKRYTDPSSLRKHMKTVHGATAQPNKKMKGEKPESRKEVVERKEKEQLEQRRKSVGECLTVKPLQQRSPGSNDDRGSSGSFCNRGQQYTPSPSLPFSSQGPPQQSDNTFGTYRAWGVQQASPASTTTSADCESAEMSPLSQQEALSPGVGAGPRSGAGGGGPTMQMQAHPRQFLPRLGGKPRASEGLLHEVSRRLSDPRRMSNTSMISMDSGAESVISSYNGSRRGSDISLQSYLSSRRSSLNSPMPPSRLSPRNIANQTVIEGKVFESASPGTTGLLDQGGQSDHIDVGHLQHNRQSRVSSGYGSQTAYFHCKSPAVQQSPTPPVKGQRRASDGNVTRLGDKIFEPANIQTPMHNKHRRGSEPISPVQIFNGELPRRNSLSSFNPLPIPESMRMSLGFHPSNDDELGRSPRMNHYIKPNLFVQHQNMVADVEPQFPPSEEELAQGSLFSSTSQQSCDSLMQAADSTVPEPGCLRIGGPIMNNNVDTWSSMQRPAPAQQRATVVAEADSTADWMTSRSNMRNTGENYEDLIVREIRGLNTGMDSRPQTNPYVGGSNMAINDMNTLLSSLNEENKYYESNRMGHGGIGNFL